MVSVGIWFVKHRVMSTRLCVALTRVPLHSGIENWDAECSLSCTFASSAPFLFIFFVHVGEILLYFCSERVGGSFSFRSSPNFSSFRIAIWLGHFFGWVPVDSASSGSRELHIAQLNSPDPLTGPGHRPAKRRSWNLGRFRRRARFQL